jgi:hypothetical protein
MRFRSARTNNEEIGKGRDALKIENDDIFRLFIRREIGADFG